MVLVLALFAIVLGFVAWRSKGGARHFLAACCLFNLFAVAAMLRDGYEYAWRLAPQRTAPGIEDPLPPPPPRP